MIEDGLHTEWWENGQKKLEVSYKDGKPDGKGKKTYNCKKRHSSTYGGV